MAPVMSPFKFFLTVICLFLNLAGGSQFYYSEILFCMPVLNFLLVSLLLFSSGSTCCCLSSCLRRKLRAFSSACLLIFSQSVSSIAQPCPTLCDPMNCSTPGLPVHHKLPEFNQTHVHRVGDAIQPSHPLSSPSPPALNLSQHQGFQMSRLFASGGQSTGVSASSSVLPMNTQD